MKKTTKLLIPTIGAGLFFGAMSASAVETKRVEPGDTYWDIAQNYEEVTTEELAEANIYSAREIPIGVELTIPIDEPDMMVHVVETGETLEDIAALYDGIVLADLMDLNPDVDPYDLVVGTEVMLVESEIQDEEYVYHIIQPETTIYDIAAVYDGVTVDMILEANPTLDPDAMVVGEEIVIPLY